MTAMVPLRLTAALAVLAGCATPLEPVPSDRFAITWVQLHHPVAFQSGGTALDPAESARLAGFLRGAPGDPGGRVTIVAPRDALGGARARILAAEVAAAWAGQVLRSDGAEALVRIDYPVVLPGVCGQAGRATGDPLPPGCATALNRARQAADPQDLLRGQQPGPAAVAPLARAAERYLSGAEDLAVAPTRALPGAEPLPSPP